MKPRVPASEADVATEVATWERCIDTLRPHWPVDPQSGIFGPDSAMWRVGREAALPVYGMRAVLLQIAHPAVAEAGVQHSNFQQEFLARTMRTFSSVYTLMFADRHTALSAARRVHQIHTRVRGQVTPETSPRFAGRRYHANDPRLLFWVLATMIESGFGAFEVLLHPMSESLQSDYYADMRRLGLLLGIPDDDMPPDVPSFRAYFRRMLSDEIDIGPAARSLVQWLFREGWDVWFLDETWAAGVLEPELLDAFGLPHGRRYRLAHQALRKHLQVIFRHGPKAVRWVPPWFEASYRVARSSGRSPGPTTRIIHRAHSAGWIPDLFALPFSGAQARGVATGTAGRRPGLAGTPRPALRRTP